ncbi:hypothetical protein BRADI_4g08821v3 [Brachypodium distachyon]|uniref:Uncharacterized protein n=1 Tax=Brachypodium distachyon TaxID=15368 RepID=A0A2K2CLE2_BRADI|nr:hypothetical protein BRADI_4g08821v3 [Brachypodium distachyon]
MTIIQELRHPKTKQKQIRFKLLKPGSASMQEILSGHWILTCCHHLLLKEQRRKRLIQSFLSSSVTKNIGKA